MNCEYLMRGHVAQRWHTDPKGLVFTLSRYKFVAKMFEGMTSVLEVGCAEGFGARIVRQHVGLLTGIDIDREVLSETDPSWPITFRHHDLLQGPFPGSFDGAYALDVLEHIDADDEDCFLRNLSYSVDKAVIIGMPSLESQPYASELSRAHHVNCKSAAELKKTMERHFRAVFLFGMQDETLHTGFGPMCNYLLALGVK